MADDAIPSQVSMTRRKWIWSMLVVVCIFALLWIGQWSVEKAFHAAVPAAGSARTTSMDLVEITLVPGISEPRNAVPPRLRLSRAYLTNPKTWNGGMHSIVTVETGLPELEPRPARGQSLAPEGTAERLDQERFWANGLYLDLAPAKDGQRNANGAWAWYTGEYGKRTGHIGVESRHGLRGLIHVPCMGSDAIEERKRKGESETQCASDKPVQELYFAFDTSGNAVVQMHCSPPWSDGRGPCTARLVHRGVAPVIVFRRAELRRWNEFIDGSRKLLDKIVLTEQ